MKVRYLATCLSLLVSVSSARAGLVISEMVYNEPGSDAGGEWIEIFNRGPSTIDLSNYKIGDEETMNPPSTESGGMWKFPAGASISPGQVQTIAVNSALFATNYGFKPTYEVVEGDGAVPNLSNYTAWSSNPSPAINMANANDQVLLLDGSDLPVDAVSWGNTFAFDPALNGDAEADGQSYERVHGYRDTNAAGDWRLGNPSSPGTVAVPEPATLAPALLGALAFAGRRRLPCD
jgi:hypothetical protein